MRQHQILRIVFLRLCIAFSTFALGVCAYALWPYERSTNTDKPEVNIEQTTPLVSGGSKQAPTVSSRPNSSIRSIDFENFTYPQIGARGTFTLKDGHEPNALEHRNLVDVVYGDVTSDGLEEAMVVFSQNIRGSAIPFFVYVYSMNGTKVRLLWSFDAGERGDGGLRQISTDGSQLSIELYGRDRVVNGGTSSEEDNMGVCCPRFFTRSYYQWRGGRFRLRTKEVQLPNPLGNAAYLPASN